MAGVLFQACLEAYQAQSYSAQSDDAEFPDMDWEGWHEIAERLGVLDTVDAPIFRVRQAVKIAVSADTKHLQGERVKFDAVEDRLCDILSGGAPMSQVPDTQAEDVMLQPAKAKIVLRERRKKQHSKQHVLFYEVMFHNHPREEGSWLSQGQLRKNFPDSWQAMIQDFNERLASGRLLEPSPSDAEADAEADAPPAAATAAVDSAGRAVPSASAGVAAAARAIAGRSVSSGGGGGGGSLQLLSAVAGRLLPQARMPVAPRNIPLESQPESQPEQLYSSHGNGSVMPASMLLAGLAPQQRQQPTGTEAGRQAAAARRVAPLALQQQRAAAAGPPLPPIRSPQRPASYAQQAQPVHGSGLRAEQRAGLAFFAQPAAQHAAAGAASMPSRPGIDLFWEPAPARAAAPGALPSYGRGGEDAAAAAAAAVGPAPRPPPGYRSVPMAPPGWSPQHAQHAAAPVPPPGYQAAATRQFGRATTAADSFFAAGSPVPLLQQQPRPPQGYASPPAQRLPLVRPAVAAAAAALPAVSGQALVAAYRRKRGAEPLPAGSALGPPRPPPGWPNGQQAAGQQPVVATVVQQEQQPGVAVAVQQEQAHAPAASAKQPAAKRRKTGPAAAAAGTLVAGGAHRTRAALQVERGPAPSDSSGRCAKRARQGPASEAAADGGSGGEKEPADAAELAFQQALPLVASLWQNKAPSPCRLDRQPQLEGQQQLVPPVPAEQAAQQAEEEATPGDDAFFDAEEELQQESSQPQEQPPQQQQQRPDPELLHQVLRTQPDDVQWTNRGDVEGEKAEVSDGGSAESLPDTQLVLGGSGGAADDGVIVVPDTEEEQEAVAAAAATQHAQQRQQKQVRRSGGAVPEQAGVEAARSGADGSGSGRGSEKEGGEGSDSEGGSDDDSVSDMSLAEHFKCGNIKGAKVTSGSKEVSLFVQLADGTKILVPTSRVLAMARKDCPGCQVLTKLTQFYESKSTGVSRPKTLRGAA
ncbi:hypothetical protein D9Q98_005540 [Chlorella vulgaris]|uniref:Uncharacterized protein n=1 Tax=Chlorella vulgaris TaxID=3077 RepID=A0A9D4TM02_CHLVU|nr:hypothetical protein D9Q98_005540 [Chlorella vulgaris]